MWHVYIVECADRTLYTGIARDVAHRIATHNVGKGARYTRSRLPVRRVYQEPQPTQSAALKREFRIKKLTRAAKLALIRQARKS